MKTRLLSAILAISLAVIPSVAAEPQKQTVQTPVNVKPKEVTLCVDMGAIDEGNKDLLCGNNMNETGYKSSNSFNEMYAAGWHYVGSYRVSGNVYNGRTVLIFER